MYELNDKKFGTDQIIFRFEKRTLNAKLKSKVHLFIAYIHIFHISLDTFPQSTRTKWRVVSPVHVYTVSGSMQTVVVVKLFY